MDVIQEIAIAFWHQDFALLTDPHIIRIVYAVMFFTLLLENSLIPASFLPGDSLLILAGALIAKGVMQVIPTMLVLLTAANLGYWFSYLQGRWLSNNRMVKGWLKRLPHHYHRRAAFMFTQYGLLALLIGRFLAFVRTLMPIMAGIAGLSSRRFQFFNWLSGALWVSIVTSLGYAISVVPFLKHYESQMMTFLILLPIVLLILGLLGTVIVAMRKKITR